MANKKISGMVHLGEGVTPDDADKLALVDVDDTTTSGESTGTTKFVKYGDLISEIAVDDMAASAVVTESEGIGSNDNDTTLPTSAAVKDYVDTNVTAQDLDFAGDSGTGSVDLDSQSLTIDTGANLTSAAGSQTLTVNLDTTITGLTSV